MPPNDRSRPGESGSETMTDAVVNTILEPTADITTACEAFVVLVSTPAGKYVRRVFLSLHSATAAVQRARAKGQPVRMVLCRVVPVAADLDLTGEWSA
jgi:UDP-N-acetyl-D-mannosaminuronate dehydrogenase